MPLSMNNQSQPISSLNTSIAPSKLHEPPHYSNLIGKTLSLDKQHNVLIEEVLAEGGFGVIFLVKNTNDKVKYAMKRVVVNNEVDYSAVVGEVTIMTTFSTKSQHILASLAHLIVSYPSTSTFELCNLMPLCSKNLFQVATSKMQSKSSFTDTEVLAIVQSVCSGLQFLHNSTPHPIIHRDIKIENILLLDDNNYVLSDFGSATSRVWDPSTDAIQQITEDLDKNTTPLYRSPEMVDLYGERGKIGVASDIWAVGVTLYKLMSFKDPFETILAIQNRNLTWPSGVKARFCEGVVGVVEVCLAEGQFVRPTVTEVLGIVGGGLVGEWGLLGAVEKRIHEEEGKKKGSVVEKKSSGGGNGGGVVMETTVTPRQRPKRGNGNVAITTTSDSATVAVGIPVLAAPPKSPKPVSPSQQQIQSNSNNSGSGGFFGPPQPNQSTISPTTQQQLTPSPTNNAPPPEQPIQQHCSWNPFDEDYYNPATATPAFCDTESTAAEQVPITTNPEDKQEAVDEEDDDDDPFAKAPFDYFKYQPIIPGAGGPSEYPQQQLTFYFAPNNPFLNYPEDLLLSSQQQQHSIVGGEEGFNVSHNDLLLLSRGVCNLSFDDEQYSNQNNIDEDDSAAVANNNVHINDNSQISHGNNNNEQQQS